MMKQVSLTNIEQVLEEDFGDYLALRHLINNPVKRNKVKTTKIHRFPVSMYLYSVS